jgi:acetyl-CoA synthetase
MENQLEMMGKRIRETRCVLDISVAEMARITGLTEAEYLAHEEAKVDSSFTFILRCAERFGVDISTLVTGDTPKLSFCTITRHEKGTPIKRRAGFEYQHLTTLLKNRHADSFIVKAPPQSDNTPIGLSTHSGQEFNYILSGRLKFQFDDKVEYLGPGDSALYDSSHPHGMIAVGDETCRFLAVVIKGEGDEPLTITTHDSETVNMPNRELLYQRFMKETLDENGYLQDVKFEIPENFNFAYDVVDELAKKNPNKTAMVWVDKNRNARRFSFKDISRYSCKAANYLVSLGIKKGDKVMLVMKRHYQFWFVINALHRIGAIAVPASNQLLQKDFEYRFKLADVKCIVCTADGEVAEAADAAAANCPTVQTKIIINGQRDGWRDFNAEIERYSDEFARPSDLLATDTGLMFFSSGTTGYPKAVEHSMTYPLGHIITARWWHNVQPDGLHFTISDTGWGKSLWGKIYGQWLCESAVLTYDFDRFVAADILSIFKEYQVTTFCAPPTMYRFFIKEDLSKYDLSSLKYATIAGEALNPEVFQQFYKATGLKVMEGFGQTETTLIIANLLGMNPKPGSMGKPSPMYKVELFDHDDKPVGTGETGEIVIKTELNQTPGIFQGYLKDTANTNASWHDGYYHTGDTAWKDEDGYFWYVGRRDDLIKSSGYRIGPFEIESVIMELPYVLECAIVGVPDETRGQVVKAYIVLTKGTEGTEDLKKEIQEYVKQHTAPYKYPRKIEFIDAMPKTVSSKIRRNELRYRDTQ